MRRHEEPRWSSKIVLVSALVLVLIVLVVWKPFGDKVEENISEIVDNNSTNVTNMDSESTEEVVVTESDTSTILKNKGLCEEYIFLEGDVLEIENHVVKLDAIGENSVKVKVDEELAILEEKENHHFDSGLKVGIDSGDIFYYSLGSKHNTVSMMIGCDYNENPYDKYVETKGQSACRKAYDQCLAIFGIEEE